MGVRKLSWNNESMSDWRRRVTDLSYFRHGFNAAEGDAGVVGVIQLTDAIN